jgi:hypothetical protein
LKPSLPGIEVSKQGSGEVFTLPEDGCGLYKFKKYNNRLRKLQKSIGCYFGGHRMEIFSLGAVQAEFVTDSAGFTSTPVRVIDQW